MITIKSPEEIEIMRKGGKILAGIMRELEKKVQPEIATKELNRAAQALVLDSQGECSFKGFQSFPACLCVSLNQEIVHALPSDRILREGDIVSLDLGLKYKGFHTDMAVTLPVGKISSQAQKLINITRTVLAIGLEEIRPGRHFGDIGFVIQSYVEERGFNAVRELCGHGIGRELHEEPQVLNYGKQGTGPEIKEGMVFCLEPMVTAGDWHLKKSPDGYGFKTKDGSLSAHFEHTVAVTKTGCRVLTE